MTPQELDERIDQVFAITKTLEDGSPDKEPTKQLIRDCIEAVTPEPISYDIKSASTEYQRGWRTGAGRVNAEYQRKLEANTKELLG